MKLKIINKSWYFLIGTIIVYLIILLIKSELFFLSLNFFFNILLKIIPIFIIVFTLMSLINYFITPNKILRYFKKKGILGWLFIIIGGILSSGPIYMWYPLLADLKNKGLNYGMISTFLYNRAIKLPLLPLAIFYFELEYVIILSLVMIFISIIQGITINKLMGDKNESSY